ncbi:MAG: PepSY domain-containing protein [Planctomycetota bacterium]|nr:MAG: PepSY domain-containing protein [Planctomycetota bacterium]
MRPFYFVIVLALTCTVGCASLESEHEDEKEIPLSQVPAEAVQAAQRAVPGITLAEAEIEQEEGCTVYELEGTADGIEYEIEVTADGKVLEVERQDQDDEEDDDENDDD